MRDVRDISNKGMVWVSLLIVVGILMIISSAATGLWVITAIPIGFLFGFFLEKADLCGASAFSEVLLVKDGRKLWGLWVIIAVGMLVFSLLSLLGLIQLSPKPLMWPSYLIGGILFGIGIVLAGGCVSGCLFKTGQGNINSMAGLIGIPIGVAAVEYGPLSAFSKYLNQFIIRNTDGGPVTLSSITGLPYGILAVMFGVLTLIAAWRFKRSLSKTAPLKENEKIPFFQRYLTKPWKPWQAGIAIGILGGLAYLSSAATGRNYPLGVTHGVLHAELLATDAPLTFVYTPSISSQSKTPEKTNTGLSTNTAPSKKVSLWLIFEVIALVAGAFFSAKLSRKIQFLPRPPDQTVIAFFGGILLGTGAAIAGGCVVGNIMSGLALMSVGNMLFAVTVLLANWATTYFYLMGGSLFNR